MRRVRHAHQVILAIGYYDHPVHLGIPGEELPHVDSHMSQWYGWVSYFPETGIYGEAADTVQAALE